MKKIKLAILVVMALMAAGCGKFHSCRCWSYTPFDIIDTALYDSVSYPLYDNIIPYERESAMECSFWSSRDTVGQYLPEYGIQMYYVIDCYEEGEVPRMEFSENGE